MKKMVSILICVLMTAMLFSCDAQIEETNQSETQSLGFNTNIVYKNKGVSFITETPTRVLYTLVDTLYYHNKVDGENYVFCFDPLCAHNDWRSCISLRFILNGVGTKIQYYEGNHRFYGLRGDKLFSFAFDGSDLKEEYSFGEDGSLDKVYYNIHYEALTVWKDRMYFCGYDEEQDSRELYYYEINNGKVVCLTEKIRESVNCFLIANDEIYIHLISETESGVYRTDMDLIHLEKLENDYTFLASDALFVGTTAYFNFRKYIPREDGKSGWESVENEIVAYDTETGEINTFYEYSSTNAAILLAANERYIYFLKPENIYIGYESMRNDTVHVDRYNLNSRIYRLDTETKEIVTVFDDLSCNVQEIYFLDNDRLMILGDHCIAGEGNAQCQQSVFVADMDENGYFINLKLLEVSQS